MTRACRAAVLAVLLALATSLVVGCSDDGRTLREPRADQTTTTADAGTATSGSGADAGTEAGVGGFTVRVDGFLPGEEIPATITCDGDNTPPTVTWQNVPSEAAELALSMTDPDAGSFVHWLVVGIDPALAGVDGADLPPGATTLLNSAGDPGWTGPCPLPGDGAHDYVFTLYAVADATAVDTAGDPSAVLSQLAGASLATTTVAGTYASTSSTVAG